MVFHFATITWILKYLKGCASWYVIFQSTVRAQSIQWCLLDWAPTDRRSTIGLFVFLGLISISWSSKKQETISRPSTKAKLGCIQQLLSFLQIDVGSPPILFCDILAARVLSFNPMQHQCTKHIKIDVQFVRGRVAKKKLFVQFFSSREQFADILTKGLNAPLFKIQWSNPVLDFSKQEIEGGCEEYNIV